MSTPRATSHPETSTRRERALLKFRLLNAGVRLSSRADEEVKRRKPPIRTRSGVSGGLDLVLPGHVHVNAATTESYAASSPLDGSEMADAPGFSAEDYVAIHEEVKQVCRPYGIVPGPTCIPCQNNTLAMPGGQPYRYYGQPWPQIGELEASRRRR